MQLVAIGAQDLYLTGNPQITLFKAIYKRHTNFAIESMEQTNIGSVDFGKKISCILAKKGDLVQTIYLDINLSISLCDIPRLGYQLIDYVEIEIGGQIIDKQYGEWMDIWSQLTHDTGSWNKLNYLIEGNIDVYTDDGNKKVYVPLQFWFCKNPGVALPLIALQHHDVKLHIYLRNRKNIRNKYGVSLGPNDKIDRLTIYCDYIYLDTDERRRFSQVGHEYLIEQIQYTNPLQVSGRNADIELNFSHPIKELVWAISRNTGYGTRIVNDNGTAFSVKATADNGAIITGSFEGTINFDGILLTSYGQKDIFVAKLLNNTWIWAVKAGGILNDTGLSVDITTDGGAIITGNFNSTAYFGQTIQISASGSSQNMFIAKISSNGIWEWVNKATSNIPDGLDTGLSISVCPDSSILISGQFGTSNPSNLSNTYTITFSPLPPITITGNDLIVAKISKEGNWMWATDASGNDFNVGYLVSTPDSGGLVVGTCNNTISFNTTQFGTITFSDASGLMYVAKIKSTGDWQWATAINKINNNNTVAISSSYDNGAYITGTFNDTVVFDSYTLTNTNISGSSLFVSRLSAGGQWLWANKADGSILNSNVGITTGLDTGAVITGGFDSDTVSFNSIVLKSKGNTDVFVANITNDGIWRWANSAGGSGEDYGLSITTLSDGYYAVAGKTYSETGNFGEYTYTTNGIGSIFVSMISPAGDWLTRSVGSYTYNQGDYVPFDYWGPNNTDLMTAALLRFNGKERFQKREATYFRCVHPYQYHSGGKQDPSNYLGGFYVYSFGLHPEKHFPTGSCNFSRIDFPILHLDITEHAKLIRVWGINYNILRIVNGYSGLVYNN